MSTEKQNLWPKDIVDTSDLVTPVSILKEQASLLGEQTQNLVEAKVETSSITNGQLMHVFYLVAPALDNYKYRLFTIYHGVELYPLDLVDPEEKIFFDPSDHTVIAQTSRPVKSQEELLERLRHIFSSPQTKKVINALIAQSR
ncbi:MAG: hypothetical protein IAF08_04030 [Rhizobacter sp.]|nr:hypothetical protein [Chlorobiales bacterium]